MQQAPRAEHEVFICQKKYAQEIFKKFKLEEYKAISTLMKQKENLRKEDGVEKVDEVQFRKLVGCLDSCIVQVNCLSRLLRE